MADEVRFDGTSFDFTPAAIADAIRWARATSVPRWKWRDSTDPGHRSRPSPHLYLVVGSRSAVFFYRGKSSGKDVTLNLGPAEGEASITLAEAREAAHTAKHGPAQLKTVRRSKGKRAGITLQAVYDKWLDEAKAGTFNLRPRGNRPLAPKTIRSYESNYGKHLKPDYGDRDLGAFVSRSVDLVRTIAGSSPSLGNQVLAISTTLIEYARRRKLYVGPNPLRDPDEALRSFVPRREISLKAEELAALVGAIEAQPPYWSSLFKFLLVTMNRLGNASNLTWAQVDFEAGVIKYKSSSTKSKKPAKDPITPVIREILEARHRAVNGSSPYVWPQHRNPAKPVRNVWTRWAEIVDKAGIDHIPPHGLKHVGVSLLDSLKVNPRVISAQAKHTDPKTTAIYSHPSTEDQAQAVDALAKAWTKAALRSRKRQKKAKRKG